MEEIVETVAVEAPFDGQAIVDKFREFRDRSKKQFDENYDSMREDRAYLNGQTQWAVRPPRSLPLARHGAPGGNQGDLLGTHGFRHHQL